MAQLKDTIIQGSARVTDTLYTTTMQAQIYQALTASNAITYGPGSNGQILTSNGSLTYWATNFAGNAASATIADRLRGFASSGTSNVSWGNQTGTQVCWANDSSGGSYSFRRDNPSSGKLSLEVDGRFYGNEGTNPAMLMNSDGTYWGMGDPDAKANVWIRTTSSGILPNQAGGATSGSMQDVLLVLLIQVQQQVMVYHYIMVLQQERQHMVLCLLVLARLVPTVELHQTGQPILL